MKTKVICEIGSNWDTYDDIVRSVEFALEHSCLPKLQAINPRMLWHKPTPKQFDLELDRCWMKKLKYAFSGNDILYSIFDLDTLEFLEAEICPPFYKIASPDCVFERLVKAVSHTGKETFISIGGATLEEIRQCVKWFSEYSKTYSNLTLLECNLSYPAKCAYLGNLRDRLNGSRLIPWGYSDHTLSTNVPAYAVTLGATTIEKHFKISHMKTPDSPHSLLPAQWVDMLHKIEEAEHHLQTLEHPFPDELPNLKLARRIGTKRPSLK